MSPASSAERTRSWKGTWRGETSATNSPYSDSLRRGSGSARTRDRAARWSIGTGSSSPARAWSCSWSSGAGGGLRHLNVWESEPDWERYRDERVGPAVGRVLAAAGITGRPPEPVEQRLHVVEVVTGA